MTLKPIPGAPIDAPIPDFPRGKPSPLVVPEPRSARRSTAPAESAPPPPVASRARRAGPVEIRGSGNLILTFRIIPEVPAINRSSMTISTSGDTRGDGSSRTVPHLDLAIDKAKAFLLALRDGDSPVVITDSRTAFQLEFSNAEDGPTFTLGRPGEARTLRRFHAGWGFDVEAMAMDLLAELGP